MTLRRSEKKSASAVEAQNERDLPSLVERLFDNITALLDQKLTLLKVELKEDLDAYIRGVIVIAGGAMLAIMGLVLVNVALAFAISILFANSGLSEPARYALGFFIASLIYMIAGAAVVIVAKNRLADRGIV